MTAPAFLLAHLVTVVGALTWAAVAVTSLLATASP